jgi:hypothetical protein
VAVGTSEELDDIEPQVQAAVEAVLPLRTRRRSS